MATAKQINFIESLARTQEGAEYAIHQYRLRINGEIDDLSTKQASALIEELLDMPRKKVQAADNVKATEKQINFILKLIAKGKHAEGPITEPAIADMDRKDASDYITALLAA